MRILGPTTLLVMLLLGCEAMEPTERATPTARHGTAGLESANADVRRESALELARVRIEDADLRARIVRRLSVMAQGDPEPLVRDAALNALVVQDPAAGLDVARRVRIDTSYMVRWDAVKIMGAQGDKSLLAPLADLAQNDPDENVRREAIKVISKYDDPVAIRALLACLGDSSLSVAHAAREALVKLSAGVDLGMDRDAWEKWWK